MSQPVQGPDGQLYQFPDGTTADDAVTYFKQKGIGGSPVPPPPPTAYPSVPGTANAQISAQPSTFGNWLQNVESDIRYGGARTAIGKVMSALGAQGTDVGSQAGAGGMLASPVLGPIHTAQGITQIPSHPLAGAWNTAKGALETATIPLMFAGGPGEAVAPSANVNRAGANLITAAKPSAQQAEKFVDAVGTASPELQKIATNVNPQTVPDALDAIAAHSRGLQPQYDAALNPVKDTPVPQSTLDSIANRIESHVTSGLDKRFPALAQKIRDTADFYRAGQAPPPKMSNIVDEFGNPMVSTQQPAPPKPITFGDLDNMRQDLGSNLDNELDAIGLKKSLAQRDPNYAYRLTERGAVKNALYDQLGPEAANVKEMQSALQTIQKVLTPAAGRGLVAEAAGEAQPAAQKLWNISREALNVHAGNALQRAGEAIAGRAGLPNAYLQRAMELYGGATPQVPVRNVVGSLAGMVSASRRRP